MSLNTLLLPAGAMWPRLHPESQKSSLEARISAASAKSGLNLDRFLLAARDQSAGSTLVRSMCSATQIGVLQAENVPQIWEKIQLYSDWFGTQCGNRSCARDQTPSNGWNSRTRPRWVGQGRRTWARSGAILSTMMKDSRCRQRRFGSLPRPSRRPQELLCRTRPTPAKSLLKMPWAFQKLLTNIERILF